MDRNTDLFGPQIKEAFLWNQNKYHHLERLYLDIYPKPHTAQTRLQMAEHVARSHPSLEVIIMDDRISEEAWEFAVSGGRVMSSVAVPQPSDDAWM